MLYEVITDDRDVTVDVPPILYHDVPLAPARLLARVAGNADDDVPALERLADDQAADLAAGAEHDDGRRRYAFVGECERSRHQAEAQGGQSKYLV